MLAGRRSLMLDGSEIERTPLLVPSFSSKGFPDINKIIHYCSELIDGVMLVSAYDIHYGQISENLDFASLIFLDSGGYEASRDKELSDTGDRDHRPRDWTRDMHEAQLAQWNPTTPSVLISYDSPKDKLPLDEQIARARAMAPRRTGVIREILLKPKKSNQIRLHMDNVLKRIHSLAEFDIIGVTEKEVGNSLIDRMKNIALLRRGLSKSGLNTPIHVFGSLDTISTPLYFLAGADIFDGLTWLRYAYHEGNTIYRHNYGALKSWAGINSDIVEARSWNDNYYYLKNLEAEMRRYLADREIRVFQYHSELFRKCLETVREAIGD